MSIRKKLITVGDPVCGKSCVLLSFIKNTFEVSGYWQPTVFETYVADIVIAGKNIELSLTDTSGKDYEHFRSMLYKGIDVVLIFFSVVCKHELNNVLEKWWPEVKQYCPDVPILLVGTKQDLRNDPWTRDELKKKKKKMVSKEDAETVAKRIGAVNYIECSVETMFNIYEVFAAAARAAISEKKKKKKKESKCVLS